MHFYRKLAATILVLTSAIVLTPLAMADRPSQIGGDYQIDGTNIDKIDHPYNTSYVNPLHNTVPDNVPEETTWELPFFTNPDFFHGVWVYADETGRVRTYAATGISPTTQSQWAKGDLVWNGTYRRGPNSKPDFTVNENELGIYAPGNGVGVLRPNGVPTPPFADLIIVVRVCHGVGGVEANNGCQVVFSHMARLEGTGDELTDVKYNNGSDVTTGGNPFAGIKPEKRIIEGTNLEAYIFTTPSITREIDLDAAGIRLGEVFTVSYTLGVSVGEDSLEHYAYAFLGDPLDVDAGGLTLLILDPPAESNARFCEHTPDPSRYTQHDNATVTDSHTGLMWQRCPLGYTLDDNGTVDLADDLCEPGLADSYDWQSALQNADIETFATYDDWRLPDVKQLESLLELSCLGSAIDTLAFPETPADAFWSSTPAEEGDKAWQVGFASGDVDSNIKSRENLVRLVRNSGTAPVDPAPGLSVSNAYLVEGDSGTSTMNFAVGLTRPASTDVSVDYQTEALTATAGSDYDETAGTLIIPAGTLHDSIAVVINGDTETEGPETLQLSLDSLSPGIYFAGSRALGIILDDESKASVQTVLSDQAEGDTGTQDFEFAVSLDKPAASPINFDYATSDLGATGDDDYVSSSGTATINTGEVSVSILVSVNGDTQIENDEAFELTISNVVGGATLENSVAVATIIDDDGPGSYQALNDTGVVTCTNLSSTLLACPQGDFPLQDGEFGRDVTDNNPDDGLEGFSFTKLDIDGVPLTNQDAIYQYVTFPSGPAYDIWHCVTDEVTGLTWEIQTDVTNDLRHYSWTYTWYNSTGVDDGGNTGVDNGGICVDGSNCDTEKYIAAINAVNLCGFNDWRLPRADELFTLGVTAAPSASATRGLDSDYFPHNYSTNGQSSRGYTYWSSTPSASRPESAWEMQFQSADPQLYLSDKSSPLAIQLVRGGQ